MSTDKANTLIKPEDVVLWIPGNVTIDSMNAGWENIAIRGYEYTNLDVHIPAMRDYMIVNYKKSAAEMRRKGDASWDTQVVKPGYVSLLTCGEYSRWAWNDHIAVTHVYISHDSITSMANKVFDYDIASIRIRDEVGVEDHVLPALTSLLELELKQGGLGGNLYLESIKNQIALHLLRQYAKLDFKEGQCRSGFTPLQRRLLLEFINENMSIKITLEDLAGLVKMSVPHLMRKFKVDFGNSPAAYIMNLRVQFAKRLLTSKKEIPLKVIASEAGFCDQSHMTRVFQKFFGKTPIEIRQEHTNLVSENSVSSIVF